MVVQALSNSAIGLNASYSWECVPMQIGKQSRGALEQGI